MIILFFSYILDYFLEMTLDEIFQKGIKSHKSGQTKEAEKLYTAILRTYPKHPDANHNMGVLYIGLGKIQESLPFFKAALTTDPNINQFWLSYIKALMQLGRASDAKSVFDQAIKKGVNGEAFNQLGLRLCEPSTMLKSLSLEELQYVINLYNQGQHQQTLSYITEMLEQFPYSATLHNLSGASNAGLGQYDAAMDSYRVAIKIKPDFAEAYYNMGIALNNNNQPDAAIDSYKKALKIQPDYAEVYNNIGVILSNNDEMEAAIASYMQALKFKPDYADVYINMGDSLRKKGDLETAIHNYRCAVNIEPDSAHAYNNMGSALKDKGDLEAAIGSYKKAIEINTDSAKAYYNLGLLFLEVKRYQEAVEFFKLSNFEQSKYYLLKCLYLQNKKLLFYQQLDDLLSQGIVHPMIGSLGCRSALRYGTERPNLFCKNPLDYVLKANLNENYDFKQTFTKTVLAILNDNRILNKKQGLLTNGYQTSGNLFSLERGLTKDIQKIIRLEVAKYLMNFKDSEEGLITNWPNDYSLNGWLITMKSGGELKPHMHEIGWLSGSIYINVPSKLKSSNGNLVVCLEEADLISDCENYEKSIDVNTGDLCLFPASLLHYTIPFESEEERIVLAFDVVPKY